MRQKKPRSVIGNEHVSHFYVGYALHLAQSGQKHPGANPLNGFGGAGVLEVVEDASTA